MATVTAETTSNGNADGGRILAAVDLGSNSFHMLVARDKSSALTVMDRLREMVRLAAGLDDSHNLSADKQDEALACLARFGERLRHFHPDDVRAVGTNTLRKAKNGDEFLERAEEALGHPIDIISGREEARLIHLGAIHGAPTCDGRRLVIDIGGGSTELILGEGDKASALYSLFMGCVSISEKYFPDGKISKSRIEQARVAVDLELTPVVGPLKQGGWKQVLGCSGTLRAVAELAHETNPIRDGIGSAEVRKLVRLFASYKNVNDVPVENLSERRRPSFMGGLIIVERLFQGLGIRTLRMADGALREGLIYDIIGARAGSNVRDMSVAALEARYQVDVGQADRVEAILADLNDLIADDWGTAKRKAALLLRYAARLHEIGLSIAHSHYHRHGAYIVGNADLAGFSRQEQSMLAWLILGHRRRLPESLPEHVPTSWRRRLPNMLALLRFAVVLARGRQETDLPRLLATVDGDALALQFPAGWLAEHPLTSADLNDESARLVAMGVKFEVR